MSQQSEHPSNQRNCPERPNGDGIDTSGPIERPAASNPSKENLQRSSRTDAIDRSARMLDGSASAQDRGPGTTASGGELGNQSTIAQSRVLR